VSGQETHRATVTDAQERPEEQRQSEAPPPGLLERVSELEAQVADLEDRLRRTLADLDNLRKRVAREAGRERAEERARVAAEWLPVIDHLEMALEHARANPSAIVDGVQAVRDQALAVLSRLGFPRGDDVGESFDPARHQAVSTVADSDQPPRTVVHVVRPRYGQGDQQLRPASVVVSTGSE
jgi:molecular chaperone GrpE